MLDDLDPSLEMEVLAALLRSDRQDHSDFLEQLALKLGLALPEQTRIERRGGFFTRNKPVEKLTLDLGETQYSLSREKHGLVARKTKIVRGVQLSSKNVEMQQWTEELAHELRKAAETSAATRQALQRFIDGG